MRHALTLFCTCTLLGGVDRAADLEGLDIVVCSFRTGDLELFAVDPITGDARNLTRSPGTTEKYPGVSPDGTHIAFISDREGGDALYVMDGEGSHVRRLAKGQPGVAGMPSWTADGQWIYFGLYGGGPPRMCHIRPDDTDFKVVGVGVDPAVAPDGKRIAYDSDGLVVANADGTNPRRMTKASGFAGVHATWTPDSKFVIYADRVGESLELFKRDPDSRDAQQLTRFGGGSAATSPAVSPDGRWITLRLCDEVYWRSSETSKRAYKERRGDKRPVWFMRADGSAPHVVEPLHYQTTIDGSRAPFLKRRPTLATAPG
jgi:TolB protein